MNSFVKELPLSLSVAKEVKELVILVGTKRGAFIFFSDAQRKFWEINGPHLLGYSVNNFIFDDRSQETIILTIEKSDSNQQLIYTSNDFGKHWLPSKIDHKVDDNAIVTCISTGFKSDQNTFYAGLSTGDIIFIKDKGKTWTLLISLYTDSHLVNSMIAEIQCHPTDGNKLVCLMSSFGLVEINLASKAIIKNQNILYHFNKASKMNINENGDVVVLDDNGLHSLSLHDTGKQEQSHPIEDLLIEHRIASYIVDPFNIKKIWAYPVNGIEPNRSVSADGHPGLYFSSDGGRSWERQDVGFPLVNGWFSVGNKSTSSDGCENYGLYVGTTNGTIWQSLNFGKSWHQLITNLPEIETLNIGLIL